VRIKREAQVRQRSLDALHPDEVPCAARLHRRRGAFASPWIFQFSEHTAATIFPIVLGIELIAYSLFTNYELGVWKVAPMAVHNLIDIAAGALLLASPWIFGFADETANVWVPDVVVGLAAIFLGLTTVQQGGYSYRKSGSAQTTAAG
jgi:hypothetical protein